MISEQLTNLLLNSFDFGYMLSVNILTYLVIKVTDYLNGDKIVPTWLKRTIAVICGLIIAGILTATNGFTNSLLYSFILSLVSWDTIFKPLLKLIKGASYKSDV